MRPFPYDRVLHFRSQLLGKILDNVNERNLHPYSEVQPILQTPFQYLRVVEGN